MRAVIPALALILFVASVPVKAKQKDQAPPPPSGSSSGESSSTPNGAPPEPAADAGTYDPVSADEDVEVGSFYMRKGDIDAAISRFQDAIKLRPNFAKPRLLAAQAYEKKGDKINALKYYKEYLQVSPKAPDAKKVQSKIDKLAGGG